jgi:hypothetical protein
VNEHDPRAVDAGHDADVIDRSVRSEEHEIAPTKLASLDRSADPALVLRSTGQPNADRVE